MQDISSIILCIENYNFKDVMQSVDIISAGQLGHADWVTGRLLNGTVWTQDV